MSGERKCPCGERTSPDPSCDMCDGWTNDSNTGWGGFTDHYLRKTFIDESEREKYIKKYGYRPIEDDEDVDWF